MILLNEYGDYERHNVGTGSRLPTNYERDRWLTRRSRERAGLLRAALGCFALAGIVLWVAWW